MAKVNLQSEEIRKIAKKNYKKVTLVVVSNLSANALYFFFNGIKRVLPGYDSEADLGNIPTFEFSCNGHYFDCELNFNGSNNNVTIDYAELIDQENNPLNPC
ncbi:hypothetical protein [Flavobacterium sp. J27]|uniref:hypothetical protein n=1 Tax=Flavobacterium sp. J27 TaxID=2060419 RepID=UPI0010326286|nr:hypothetical protein [Flavobacterium sp. J27]